MNFNMDSDVLRAFRQLNEYVHEYTRQDYEEDEGDWRYEYERDMRANWETNDYLEYCAKTSEVDQARDYFWKRGILDTFLYTCKDAGSSPNDVRLHVDKFHIGYDADIKKLGLMGLFNANGLFTDTAQAKEAIEQAKNTNKDKSLEEAIAALEEFLNRQEQKVAQDIEHEKYRKEQEARWAKEAEERKRLAAERKAKEDAIEAERSQNALKIDKSLISQVSKQAQEFLKQKSSNLHFLPRIYKFERIDDDGIEVTPGEDLKSCDNLLDLLSDNVLFDATSMGPDWWEDSPRDWDYNTLRDTVVNVFYWAAPGNDELHLYLDGEIDDVQIPYESGEDYSDEDGEYRIDITIDASGNYDFDDKVKVEAR